MNAERLHVIVNALMDEMSEAGTASLVEQLRANLQQAVNEPNQPGPQQEVSNLRSQLKEKLSQAPSNGFSPAWREALDELGVADLVGERLLEQIETILSRNEITPSAAVSELDPLVERVQQLQSALGNVHDGLSFLKIGAEELEPGDFEIGFLIPREAVGDELESLGLEFVRLKKILGPFLEIETGSREDVHIRSISSSAFGTFLHSAPAVALIVASTMERLIASYKNVLEIRLAHQKLKEAGASDKTLQSAAADADSAMGREIGVIVDELLKEAPESGRANEMRKDLTYSLNALANRIDRGYSVDVRAGVIEPPADQEEEKDMSAEEQEERDIVEKVLSKQESLRFVNLGGSPILALPEPTNAEETSARRAAGLIKDDEATEEIVDDAEAVPPEG